MQDLSSLEKDFLNKITEIIEENLSNEKFGVSELAHEIGMSRSNLLRKVKKLTNLSVSQFIRQVRLSNSVEMLKQNSLSISEISYEVGFSSASYFIKCFREHYGYSPGQLGKIDINSGKPIQMEQPKKKKAKLIIGSIGIIAILITSLLIFIKPFSSEHKKLEKSIAVLPFINDSNDSTNVHIINGLMESILNNLQKIEDLRVISRTSVEKYRKTQKSIPEIAKELNVSYFIEGSGQKIDDKIQLSVQLIEAKNDKHLWAEQYNREASDIFSLQKEVAKSIAKEIQAIITPEEEEQINKIPTDNLVAYEHFLKARELMSKENFESLQQSIPYLQKAIEIDKNFASAYSAMAIVYYYLDIYKREKHYTNEININADKALFINPKLPEGLLAKGLYYMHIKDNKQAIPYLEKAHEYNPNSSLILNILLDFYTSHIPNTQKYLEYALKGERLNVGANDSLAASYINLHISNAFIQTGFVEQAENYIDKSLKYSPENIFSQYVKAYILYAKNKDLKATKTRLLKTLSRDTSRIDVLQEVGKIFYYMRDYENAYKYFKKFNEARDSQGLDIFRHINVDIGFVYERMGYKKDADKYFADYKNFAENDASIYKDLELAMYYSYTGETQKAIEHLKLFSQQNNYHFWTILFVKIEPLLDNIKDDPEFVKIWEKIETKFWDEHKQIKTSLKAKGLI